MNKKSQVAHAVISKRYKMYKAGKVWLFAGLSAAHKSIIRTIFYLGLN